MLYTARQRGAPDAGHDVDAASWSSQMGSPGTDESFWNFCYKGQQRNWAIVIRGCGIKEEFFSR